MALSYHQKMAISWTDWGCGLASAPALGPGSFLVGGAASMALYHIFMADKSSAPPISNR